MLSSVFETDDRYAAGRPFRPPSLSTGPRGFMNRTPGFSIVGLPGGDRPGLKGGDSELMVARLAPTFGLGGVYTLRPDGGVEGDEHDLSFEGALAIGSGLG